MIKFSKKRDGYTLLELVVSVAVMTLLATLIGPNIAKGRQDQELTQSAVSLQAKLVQVQSLSLSPPPDNGGATKYGLSLVNSGNDIRYQVVRFNDANSPKIADYPLTTTTVYKGLQLAQSPMTVWYEIGNNPVITVEPIVGSPPIVESITIRNNRGQFKKLDINRATGAINVTN